MTRRLTTGAALALAALSLTACASTTEAPATDPATTENSSTAATTVRPEETVQYTDRLKVEPVEYEGRALYCTRSTVYSIGGASCDFDRFWFENPDLKKSLTR